MTNQKNEDGRDLWRAVWQSERAFVQARIAFLSGAADRLDELRSALRDPAQRGAALRVCSYLSADERKQLFGDLLGIASVAHADIGLCREVIRSLPKDWLLTTIEGAAEPLLQTDAREHYRRLLELYWELDAGLVHALATRALASEDEEVREAGEDFLARLQRRGCHNPGGLAS